MGMILSFVGELDIFQDAVGCAAVRCDYYMYQCSSSAKSGVYRNWQGIVRVASFHDVLRCLPAPAYYLLHATETRQTRFAGVDGRRALGAMIIYSHSARIAFYHNVLSKLPRYFLLELIESDRYRVGVFKRSADTL